VSKSGGAYPIIIFESTSALRMASCEPRRTSPYSDDLRWRMVWQRLARGLTLEQVSSNLNVDISTIWRVVKCFEETGTVSKKNHPTEGSAWPGKKSDEDCATHNSSCDSGDIYLQEIQSDVYEWYRCKSLPSMSFLERCQLEQTENADDSSTEILNCEHSMYLMFQCMKHFFFLICESPACPTTTMMHCYRRWLTSGTVLCSSCQQHLGNGENDQAWLQRLIPWDHHCLSYTHTVEEKRKHILKQQVWYSSLQLQMERVTIPLLKQQVERLIWTRILPSPISIHFHNTFWGITCQVLLAGDLNNVDTVCVCVGGGGSCVCRGREEVCAWEEVHV